MIGIGGLLGLMLGLGVHLALTGMGPIWARSYLRRMEPYMRPATHVESPTTVWLGATRAGRIAERQRRAGEAPDPAAHVLVLVTWCGAGVALGAGAIALLGASGTVHQPLAAIPLLVVCATVGGLLADHRLDTAAKRRREAAVVELPTLAEALAIAVGAGASLSHACELASQRGSGVLSGALAGVVESVRVGGTLDRALAGMAIELPVAAVGRFVDALRIALDRGTPIVDVLHAQASDARSESRRLLMERAGRREVAMLVPVVFLVLPAVVVIALYPGFRELTTMV